MVSAKLDTSSLYPQPKRDSGQKTFKHTGTCTCLEEIYGTGQWPGLSFCSQFKSLSECVSGVPPLQIL